MVVQYAECLAYAGDIMLLNRPVIALHNMLDISSRYSYDFDVLFNAWKSLALKIGPRCDIRDRLSDVPLIGLKTVLDSMSFWLGTY